MRVAVSLAATVTALVVSAIPAAASQSLPVTIDVYNTVEGNVIVSSHFIAAGPAVNEGLICAAGTVTDDSSRASGPPSFERQNFLVVKVFDCDDGSGSFTALLSVHGVFDPAFYVSAQWDFLGGTGNYSHIHGTGSLVATWDSGNILHDAYSGSVHID